MDTAPLHHVAHLVKAGMLTLFTILLVALMGGVMLPITRLAPLDMLLWLLLACGLAALHLNAAYRARVRAAEGAPVSALAILADVSYEVLGLVAGGFFGVLLAWVTWHEYGRTGFGGHTPLMAGLALLGVGAFLFSARRLVGYLRPTAGPPSPGNRLVR